MVAYGFVRALMGEAAERVGLHPRELSFTRAYGLLDVMSSKLCSARPAERQRAYDRRAEERTEGTHCQKQSMGVSPVD